MEKFGVAVILAASARFCHVFLHEYTHVQHKRTIRVTATLSQALKWKVKGYSVLLAQEDMSIFYDHYKGHTTLPFMFSCTVDGAILTAHDILLLSTPALVYAVPSRVTLCTGPRPNSPREQGYSLAMKELVEDILTSLYFNKHSSVTLEHSFPWFVECYMTVILLLSLDASALPFCSGDTSVPIHEFPLWHVRTEAAWLKDGNTSGCEVILAIRQGQVGDNYLNPFPSSAIVVDGREKKECSVLLIEKQVKQILTTCDQMDPVAMPMERTELYFSQLYAEEGE
jgi:hypothetical protein